MAEVGTQVNITELRDILPVGTVVKDLDGVEYTRAYMGPFGWVTAGVDQLRRPPLPLVIMSRPNR